MICAAKRMQLDNAYLHYDNNNFSWIRRGKVTRRGFCTSKQVTVDDAFSILCMHYTTKSSMWSISSSCQRYFNSLTQFAAIDFRVGNGQTNEIASNDFEDGDNKIEKSKINGSNKAVRNTTALKWIDWIVYLARLACDLFISHIHNVSNILIY